MKVQRLSVLLGMVVVNLFIARAACAQLDRSPRLEQAQLGDPYIPPVARHPTTGMQTSGTALQAQAIKKLRQQFNEADVKKNGTLTQTETRMNGLGFVADNFEHIDTRRTGRVSFADVEHFMHSQSVRRK